MRYICVLLSLCLVMCSFSGCDSLPWESSEAYVMYTQPTEAIQKAKYIVVATIREVDTHTMITPRLERTGHTVYTACIDRDVIGTAVDAEIVFSQSGIKDKQEENHIADDKGYFEEGEQLLLMLNSQEKPFWACSAVELYPFPGIGWTKLKNGEIDLAENDWHTNLFSPVWEDNPFLGMTRLEDVIRKIQEIRTAM